MGFFNRKKSLEDEYKKISIPPLPNNIEQPQSLPQALPIQQPLPQVAQVAQVAEEKVELAKKDIQTIIKWMRDFSDYLELKIDTN